MSKKDHTDNTEALSPEAEAERRKLLKRLTAGGSAMAVAKWTAPVVSAIAIPVHAQTSLSISFNAIAP